MSKDRGKNLPARSKKPTPAARRQAAEVKPMSPLGLVGAVVAALAIAAILLFVINTRINSAKPAPTIAAPTAAVKVATATPAGSAGGVTQTGGFSKGNAAAKVTFTEFADFK
jgi:hypothetical protein